MQLKPLHLTFSVPRVLFCIVVLIPTCFSMPGYCKAQWTYSEPSNTCIKTITRKMDWYNARDACRASKAELLSIRSSEMNDFVANFLQFSRSGHWIGLNDLQSEGVYKWLTPPTQAPYIRWLTGDPNGFESDDCVQINNDFGRATKSWTDDRCSMEAKFICERKRECLRSEYGEDCEYTCPANCDEYGRRFCDLLTGACISCKPGYQGVKCDSQCNDMTYGIGCSRTCSPNCLNRTTSTRACHWATGVCFGGCKAGFNGNDCEQTCPENTFGENCNRTCSHSCQMSQNGTLCDRYNGTCFGGCNPGYLGSDCFTECTSGFFGIGCKEMCSPHCNGTGKMCNHVNGTCLSGCKPGSFGPKCLRVTEKKTTEYFIPLFLLLVLLTLLLCLLKKKSKEHKGEILAEQGLPTAVSRRSKKSEAKVDGHQSDLEDLPENLPAPEGNANETHVDAPEPESNAAVES